MVLSLLQFMWTVAITFKLVGCFWNTAQKGYSSWFLVSRLLALPYFLQTSLIHYILHSHVHQMLFNFSLLHYLVQTFSCRYWDNDLLSDIGFHSQGSFHVFSAVYQLSSDFTFHGTEFSLHNLITRMSFNFLLLQRCSQPCLPATFKDVQLSAYSKMVIALSLKLLLLQRCSQPYSKMSFKFLFLVLSLIQICFSNFYFFKDVPAGLFFGL